MSLNLEALQTWHLHLAKEPRSGVLQRGLICSFLKVLNNVMLAFQDHSMPLHPPRGQVSEVVI